MNEDELSFTSIGKNVLTKIIPNYILLTVFKSKNQQYNHI